MYLTYRETVPTVRFLVFCDVIIVGVSRPSLLIRVYPLYDGSLERYLAVVNTNTVNGGCNALYCACAH